MKKISIVLVWLSIFHVSAVMAQTSVIQTAIHGFSYDSIAGTIQFEIWGRQGTNYGASDNGIFASNLRYDVQLKSTSGAAVALTTTPAPTVTVLAPTIFTGGWSMTLAPADAANVPANSNGRFGLTATRNNPTDPNLPTLAQPMIPMARVVYHYTVAGVPGGGLNIAGNSTGSTISLRTYSTVKGSSWSDFNAGSGNSFFTAVPVQPLPINLLSFDARKTDDRRVQLNWETATDQGADYFDVERSADGKSFTDAIRRVQANEHNTGSLIYQTYDNAPMQGDNYYRLKLVGKDGKFSNSLVQKVNFTDIARTDVAVVPNPVSSQAAHMLITVNQDQEVNYNLTDATGRTVRQGKLNAIKGTATYPLDMSSIATGVYYLNAKGVTLDGQVKITKIQ